MVSPQCGPSRRRVGSRAPPFSRGLGTGRVRCRWLTDAPEAGYVTRATSADACAGRLSRLPWSMSFSRPDPPPDAVPAQALRAAVARGVITEAQHAAVLALAGMAPPAEQRGEAPRGFNWVTVAYAAGAAAVLFAFGWFLVDRWSAL